MMKYDVQIQLYNSLFSLVLLLLVGNAWGQPPRITYQDGVVMVSQTEKFVEEAAEVLQVYVGKLSVQEVNERTPVVGNYKIKENEIGFIPFAPFSLGTTYTAIYKNKFPYTFQVEIPLDYVFAEVVQAYPSSDSLPANTLKFHIQFSQSMSTASVLPHIQLKDESGKPVERAFLELTSELWNTDRTLLTLWIEPGRIKRDLGPNQRIGPVLQPGERYELTISDQLKDKNGVSIASVFQKSFYVLPDDRTQPDYKSWKITVPQVATKQALTIDFRESMDFATATAYLTLYSPDGQPEEGIVQISKNESLWQFTPEESWKKGQYSLHIQTILEDVAGNNLQRPFDRDLQTEASVFEKKVVTLPIEIR